MLSLDVGCGYIKGLHQKRGTIGIDLNRGICDLRADAQHLPFQNEVFDSVSIISVLEHLPKPLICLEECLRVAKQTATFEIKFPVEPNECKVELRRMLLEFPFGIPAAFNERWHDWKHKTPNHLNRIQPRHIQQHLQIMKISLEGSHAWFQGKKGKLLRAVCKKPPVGGWKDWHIMARKHLGLFDELK